MDQLEEDIECAVKEFVERIDALATGDQIRIAVLKTAICQTI